MGALTALVTPFRDGAVNATVYEADVERQIEAGIAGIVACGTTAETPTLSDKEWAWLIRAAVVACAGRAPVIAGTGTNSTAGTIEATREARSLDADAALVVTPYYNRPSQEGLFRHFEAVAAATDLPVILYNVPSRTGVDLDVDTVERLAQLDGIAGIKDATGRPERCQAIRARTPAGFRIYSGDDGTTLEAIRAGADGAISVISNAYPAEWQALCELTRSGREAEAGQLLYSLSETLEALALETNPGPIKYLLSLTCPGHSTEVRLPLVPIGPAAAAQIRRAIDRRSRAGWLPLDRARIGERVHAMELARARSG